MNCRQRMVLTVSGVIVIIVLLVMLCAGNYNMRVQHKKDMTSTTSRQTYLLIGGDPNTPIADIAANYTPDVGEWIEVGNEFYTVRRVVYRVDKDVIVVDCEKGLIE